MDELGQRGCRCPRPSTRQASQAREHGLGLLKADVRDLAAVPSVPAKRRPAESPTIVDQEQDELKRVREADEVDDLDVAFEAIVRARSRWLRAVGFLFAAGLILAGLAPLLS
jgi:hypothetical protein